MVYPYIQISNNIFLLKLPRAIYVHMLMHLYYILEVHDFEMIFLLLITPFNIMVQIRLIISLLLSLKDSNSLP